MSKIFVKPGADRKVPVPNSRPMRFVPDAGMELEPDMYVQRCLMRGDLVEVTAEKKAAPAADTGAKA